MNAIITTLNARCKDCYKCVRVCPVNAIGIENNQAYIDQDKCITCGTCVRECPQEAKAYRRDGEKVLRLIDNYIVVASIAPSFSAIYGKNSKRIPAALRKLGFKYVCETSEGALKVTQEAIKINNSLCGISSACPVVVNYIEKYKPEHINNLIPLLSPMIAHGKLLKQRFFDKNVKVVFIGPCIAKKEEADKHVDLDAIDAVITFEELDQLLIEQEIEVKNCPVSDFDNESYIGSAKLFALPGGMLKTAEKNVDIGSRVIHTSGSENIKEIFDNSVKELTTETIEPLFCKEGCINGPGIKSDKNIFKRRADLIRYATSHKDEVEINDLSINIDTSFENKLINIKNVSQAEIEKVYKATGKANPDLQLDCGACGYSSCLEQAKAVVRGLAQESMCMPYMRRLAETRTDEILKNSPNGIVILNTDLEIISINPSFMEFFTCNESIIGRNISYIVDSEPFEKLLTNQTKKVEMLINSYGKKFHQIAYKLPNDSNLVGVYSDITSIQLTQNKLENVKNRTIEQAKELLDHQIEMSLEIAKFLGESTAKSEEIVERLLNVYEKE
jgi:iron only hydrogenase large subunit-like protein